MKAWICEVGKPGYGYIALVYADTRNQARASLAGFYDSGDEYGDIRARRCPKMDGRRQVRGVCEDEALMLESGEFWACEEHGRLTDDTLRCPQCWKEEEGVAREGAKAQREEGGA